MAVFGLGDDDASKQGKKQGKKAKQGELGKTAKTNGKADDSQTDNDAKTQEDEAKAMLERMQAKSDADECPFC